MHNLPSLGPRGEGWVVLQFVLLGLVAIVGWGTGPDWSGPPRAAGLATGIALIASGGILATRGLVDLREALTPLPLPREGAQMVETGVYRLARHPIYGGIILAAIGWGLIAASLIALGMAATLAAFFLLKSTREEAWLVSRYPGYEGYRRRTRRFIPWIG